MDVKRDVSSFSVPPGRSPVLLGSAVLRTPSAALPGRFLRSQKEPSPLGGWRGLNTRTKSSSEGEDICQLDPAPVARHKPHWLKGPNWDPSLASYKQWKWQEVCPPLRGNGVCPREGDGHQEGTPSPSGPAPSLCRRPGEDPLSTFLAQGCLCVLYSFVALLLGANTSYLDVLAKCLFLSVHATLPAPSAKESAALTFLLTQTL